MRCPRPGPPGRLRHPKAPRRRRRDRPRGPTRRLPQRRVRPPAPRRPRRRNPKACLRPRGSLPPAGLSSEKLARLRLTPGPAKLRALPLATSATARIKHRPAGSRFNMPSLRGRPRRRPPAPRRPPIQGRLRHPVQERPSWEPRPTFYCAGLPRRGWRGGRPEAQMPGHVPRSRARLPRCIAPSRVASPCRAVPTLRRARRLEFPRRRRAIVPGRPRRLPVPFCHPAPCRVAPPGSRTAPTRRGRPSPKARRLEFPRRRWPPLPGLRRHRTAPSCRPPPCRVGLPRPRAAHRQHGRPGPRARRPAHARRHWPPLPGLRRRSAPFCRPVPCRVGQPSHRTAPGRCCRPSPGAMHPTPQRRRVAQWPGLRRRRPAPFCRPAPCRVRLRSPQTAPRASGRPGPRAMRPAPPRRREARRSGPRRRRPAPLCSPAPCRVGPHSRRTAPGRRFCPNPMARRLGRPGCRAP